MAWQDDVRRLVPERKPIDVVISPDVDGLLSASAINARSPVRIAGIYTTRHVILLGDATLQDARRALWIDHDISRADMRCIGQHLTLHTDADELPLRCRDSFNPNNHVRQAYRGSFRGVNGRGRDKYPFGTVHLLRNAFDIPAPNVGTAAFAALAHADGSWGTACDYTVNCEWWRDNFFQGDAFIAGLTAAYTAVPSALACHVALAADLVAAGVNTRKAREKDSTRIPEAWADLQGKQSVSFAVRLTSQNNLRSLEAKAQKLRGVARVLSLATGLAMPTISRVREYVSGQYEEIYPNQLPPEGFDAFMVEKSIFSHAFTAQDSLRYTTDLFDD